LRVLCARVGGKVADSESTKLSKNQNLWLTPGYQYLPHTLRKIREGWGTPGEAISTSTKFDQDLLQTFNQIQIAEGAMEAVDVSLPVRRHLNWSDRRNARGIDRNNLFPDSFLSRG